MIEIPKYSIGTFNPNALEDNRRTDFTRRIPTGLSDKQMARDSKIAMQIIRAAEGGTDGGGEQRVLDLFCVIFCCVSLVHSFHVISSCHFTLSK